MPTRLQAISFFVLFIGGVVFITSMMVARQAENDIPGPISLSLIRTAQILGREDIAPPGKPVGFRQQAALFEELAARIVVLERRNGR